MRYTQVNLISSHPLIWQPFIPFELWLLTMCDVQAGLLDQKFPLVTTDPNKLEAQAKSKLRPEAYNYVAGGAGERATMDANRLAFRQWKMVPRMLRPTSKRDLTVELFGEKYGKKDTPNAHAETGGSNVRTAESPVLMAPIGVQSIFHEDKETGLAQVCAEIGVPFVLSTASSSSIEEVARASGSGPRWYQLYWPQTEEVTESLLKRAQDSGYKVLVVTLDTWALAWRPADLDGAYIPFAKGVGNRTGFTDPAFRRRFTEKYGANVEDSVESTLLASKEWTGEVFSGAAHTWDQIAHLQKHWNGPIVLKGIQASPQIRIYSAVG